MSVANDLSSSFKKLNYSDNEKKKNKRNKKEKIANYRSMSFLIAQSIEHLAHVERLVTYDLFCLLSFPVVIGYLDPKLIKVFMHFPVGSI